MAAVTLAVATSDTGASPNTSGAFTPTSDNLLVVFVTASNTAATGSSLTSSVGGFTFTLIDSAVFGDGTKFIYVYISDALVSSAVSQTVTWGNSSDESSGTNIIVFEISGMTKIGSSASLQTAKQESASSSTTPEVIFASACLTGNATLGCIGNNTNPAGVTEPTGWTEASDTGYATPTTGAEAVYRDSGFTGTTITWGSTYGSLGGALAIELDTSIDNTILVPNPASLSV